MKAKLLLALFWILATAAVLKLTGCGPADSAQSARISINEVMAANRMTVADEAGEFDDWIELYNPTDQEVCLEGFFISDDTEDAFKKRLPADLKVPAKGVLLLWADKDPEQGPNHLPFKLKAAGETVTLTDSDGALLDGVDFEAAVQDQVFGRFPDAEGEFIACSAASPGEKNGASCPR